VSSDNEDYSSTDGVLFNEAKTVLMQFPAACGLGSYEIPSGVVEILDSAFEHCYSLTEVTIPESVEVIGSQAFLYCTGLVSLTIQGANTSTGTSIGEDAFSYCESLGEVNLEDGVSSIGDSGFNSCTSLSTITIPNTVESIGAYAFAWCTGLTGVTIGNEVTIGENVFAYEGNDNIFKATYEDSESGGGGTYNYIEGLWVKYIREK
jgi:hypothetical protein